MRVGVIDVGSNSVRLLLAENWVKSLKVATVTKLAEGLDGSGALSQAGMKRTLDVICEYVDVCNKYLVDSVYAFGTEALRKATNSVEFIGQVERETGVKIEVIDGEMEAQLGLLGALKGRDGGLIDLGGASLEVTVQKSGKVVYAKSLPIGVVRMKDRLNQFGGQAIDYAKGIIEGFNDLTNVENWTIIGGSATQLKSIDLALDEYDAEMVNGQVFTLGRVREMAQMLKGKSVQEIAQLKGSSKSRAETIYGGAVIIYLVMDMLAIKQVTVSEDDNLDGYLLKLKEKI